MFQKITKKNKKITLLGPGLSIHRAQSGFGLFTKEPILRGDFIIEYFGKKLTHKEAEYHLGRYLFEINNRWTIDGSDRENKARYINHSCRPNCEPEVKKERVFIFAKKNIPVGEELTYDYGKEYFNEFIKSKGCHCNFCDGKGKRTR